MDEDTAHLTLWAMVKLSAEPSGDIPSDLINEKTKGKKQLLSINLQPQWTAKDVQVALLKAMGLGSVVPASAHSIVKVRDAHGALLPLTPTALHSSPVHPLVVEVCAPHQHVNVEDGHVDALPPTFRTAVEAIIKRFEVRLAAVEVGLEGLEGRRAEVVEEELHRIQETLAFMSRRLDITQTPTWVTGQT